MNTKIHYLYRDADNYKVHNSCVIKGVLTPEQINVILSCCDAGEYFIPNQVGLPERKFEKIDPQVDHCWFELTRDDFEYTDQPAKHKKTILLLCDMSAPMLPCICPPRDLENKGSLGSVLAAAHVSDSLIRNNLTTHRRLGYLSMLGLVKGESEYTYPPYSDVQARELIDGLRNIAPYPRKARFRVKAKGNGLALRRKGRFVMDDNAHIRLTLHAPD